MPAAPRDSAGRHRATHPPRDFAELAAALFVMATKDKRQRGLREGILAVLTEEDERRLRRALTESESDAIKRRPERLAAAGGARRGPRPGSPSGPAEAQGARAIVRAMSEDRIGERDRIAEITIEGLRCIDRLTLPTRGLTVLIGENGTGKSSIVEAFEILRRAPAPTFYDAFGQAHGGLYTLLRHGAQRLALGATVVSEGGDPPLRYEISMTPSGPAGLGGVVLHEKLVEGTDRLLVERTADRIWALDDEHPRLGYPGDALLSQYPGSAASAPGLRRAVRALASIDLHLPFDVFPMWAAKAHNRPSPMRGTMLLQRTDRLDRLGSNLANAYHSLRMEQTEAHWRETMDYVRLGLGDRIESVNTRADASGGSVALWIKLRNDDAQIPAASLSDGMLVYLAFVALFRLHRSRSILVFDEPDLHLHPAMLARVTGFFESMADDGPVLVTTHSDRLLDTLRDPAAVVRVCEIDEPAARTRVHALDREALAAWLDTYRGVGELRSAGFLSSVLGPREPA